MSVHQKFFLMGTLALALLVSGIQGTSFAQESVVQPQETQPQAPQQQVQPQPEAAPSVAPEATGSSVAMVEGDDCGCQDCCQGNGRCRGCRSCGIRHRIKSRVNRCPRCSCEVCELKVDEGKKKKTCYKVEEKVVCVPRVRLPWQKCNSSNCSPTIRVRVLKKHTYECPECQYEWKVVKSEGGEPAEAASASGTPQIIEKSATTFSNASTETHRIAAPPTVNRLFRLPRRKKAVKNQATISDQTPVEWTTETGSR